LKLSGADADALLHHITRAQSDYRDVLVPTEYPNYSGHGYKLPPEGRQRIVEQDWQQYQEWFQRSS
jgi:hypothetical protein